MNKKNLIIFYIFSFLIGFYVANGTTILFEQKLGFSYSQVFDLGAVYMLMFIIFNVPTGALADIFGRKKTLIAGSLLLVLAAITTGLSHNFLQVFLSFFLWSAGFCFIIGADQALLYDVTKDDKTYAKDWGRASFFALIGTAAAGVVGPMLYAHNFRYPYLFSAVPFFLAAVVFLFFKEGRPKGTFSWADYKHKNITGIKLAFSNKHVLWATGILAVVFGAMYTLTNSYQPYLVHVGFSIKAFSIILPIMFLLEASGGAMAGKLYSKWGDKAVFIFGLVGSALMLGVLGLFASKLSLIFLFSYNLMQGVLDPVTSAYTNRHIEGDLRATIISAQTMVATFVAALMLFIFGALTDKVGLNNLLIILGSMVFVFGGVLLFFKPSERKSA
jgi:MFS family permease